MKSGRTLSMLRVVEVIGVASTGGTEATGRWKRGQRSYARASLLPHHLQQTGEVSYRLALLAPDIVVASPPRKDRPSAGAGGPAAKLICKEPKLSPAAALKRPAPRDRSALQRQLRATLHRLQKLPANIRAFFKAPTIGRLIPATTISGKQLLIPLANRVETDGSVGPGDVIADLLNRLDAVQAELQAIRDAVCALRE